MLTAYNITADDLADGDYAALFEQRRRNALFAGAFPQPDGSTIAVRDHLGAVAMFYRRTPEGWRFSVDMAELIEPTDTLDIPGLHYYLGNGSTKTESFIQEIDVVPPGAVLRFSPGGDEPETLYRYLPTPVDIPFRTPLRDIVARFEELLRRATERTIKADTIGLYLSGGVDSYLVGKYLTQFGVRVNGYTSATWGAKSTDLPFARISAEKIGVAEHHVHLLQSDDYAHAIQANPSWYGVPFGSTTSIGVTSLWENTPIRHEQQIYYGQNADNIFMGTTGHYLVYFATRAPRFLQARVLDHTYPEAYRTFVAFRSRGLVNDHAPTHPILHRPQFTDREKITLAAMIITNGGGVMPLPAIRQRIPLGNPFHDMDLIEFGLGVPLRHLIAFTPGQRSPFTIEKRPIQHIARADLSHEHIYRKKGFSVSLKRDAATTTLIDTLPRQMAGISLSDLEHRFAAAMLEPWLRQRLTTF